MHTKSKTRGSLPLLITATLFACGGNAPSPSPQPTPSNVVRAEINTPVSCPDLLEGIKIPANEWYDKEAEGSCTALTGVGSETGVHTLCTTIEVLPEGANLCKTLRCMQVGDTGAPIEALFTINAVEDHQVVWNDRRTGQLIKVVEQNRILNGRDCWLPRFGVKAKK